MTIVQSRLLLPINSDGKREHFVWPSTPHQFVFDPHDESGQKSDFVLSKSSYLSMVDEAIKRLKEGEANKVVLSRIKRLELNSEPNLDVIFERLSEAYPNCLVSLVSLSDGSHWIGATPEVLLKKRGEHYNIMSLAGSQRNTGIMPQDYEWGKKEEREQETVTSFIRSELLAIGASDVTQSQAYTHLAGPVVHRRTDLQFSFKGDVETLVRALHPTPAVGGFPKEKALEMINSLEPHSRGFYTGVIGVKRKNGDCDLFVNLRCMRIRGRMTDLFVGGGIMPDSESEKEWEETELKSQTLMKFLDASQT
jgi:isochorismate synthase